MALPLVSVVDPRTLKVGIKVVVGRVSSCFSPISLIKLYGCNVSLSSSSTLFITREEAVQLHDEESLSCFKSQLSCIVGMLVVHASDFFRILYYDRLRDTRWVVWKPDGHAVGQLRMGRGK